MSQTEILLTSRVPPFLMVSLESQFVVHARDPRPAPEVLAQRFHEECAGAPDAPGSRSFMVD